MSCLEEEGELSREEGRSGVSAKEGSEAVALEACREGVRLMESDCDEVSEGSTTFSDATAAMAVYIYIYRWI